MQPVIRRSFVSFPRNDKPKGKCVISGVRRFRYMDDTLCSRTDVGLT